MWPLSREMVTEILFVEDLGVLAFMYLSLVAVSGEGIRWHH
jgi:hypothetical protein